MLLGKRKAGLKTHIYTASKRRMGQQAICMIELDKSRAKQAAQKRAKRLEAQQNKSSKEPTEEASTAKPHPEPQKYTDLDGIEKTFGSDVMNEYKDNAGKVTIWKAVEPDGFLLGREASIVQNRPLLTLLRKLAKHYRGQRKQKHQLCVLFLKISENHHIPFQIIVGGLFFEVTDKTHILNSLKHRFRQIRSKPKPDDINGEKLGEDNEPSTMPSKDFQEEIDRVFKEAGYNLANSKEQESNDSDVALAPKQEDNAGRFGGENNDSAFARASKQLMVAESQAEEHKAMSTRTTTSRSEDFIKKDSFSLDAEQSKMIALQQQQLIFSTAACLDNFTLFGDDFDDDSSVISDELDPKTAFNFKGTDEEPLSSCLGNSVGV